MPSATKTGNYYKTRTKKWLEKDGWTVANMETQFRIVTKDKKTGADKVIFVKRDTFGADLMAMNGSQMLFVQVKTNKGDMAAGLKELAKHPYPSFVELWVVRWEPRAREPEVAEVNREYQL